MQFPAGGDDFTSIISLVIYIFFFIYIIFAQRIQMWTWIKQIEGALSRLELMVNKGKKITIKTIKEVGKPDIDPTPAINDFLEFFTIEPVDKDPFGVLKRLEHIIDVREERFESAIKHLAPNASDSEVSNLENLLEAAMAVYFIFRVVRHYLILGKKSKSQILILQLQMMLPEIMRIANAYFDALLAFSEGKPIGDSVGPLVVARIANEYKIKNGEPKVISDLAKDTIVYELKFEGRKLYLVRAAGPGGNVGKPGEAIRKIVEMNKDKVARIITIDAALKLEGEKTGDVAEGVGAAIGGFGVEKYKMEETGVNFKVPIDAIIIKQSIEEAVTPMRREISEAADKVIEKIKRAIRERSKPDDVVIVAGIGNTIGIGN
ncbi:MAG: DUF1512 domain-containing protein [Candidatus Odinarchaeia archaeon]